VRIDCLYKYLLPGRAIRSCQGRDILCIAIAALALAGCAKNVVDPIDPEPMVFSALSSPTVVPLLSGEDMANFTMAGDTEPRSISGNTNSIRQERSDAHTRNPVFTNSASNREMPAIIYLPTTGIRAIHTPAISILP